MVRATLHIPAEKALGGKASGTVTLAFTERHRRRIRMISDAGEPFLLDLDQAVLMRHGDQLLLEDGGLIEVRAAEEPVIDIDCDGTEQTTRGAWHLGNRHTPIQILPGGRLRILEDHVLFDLLTRLGAHPRRGVARFEPEAGAYEGGSNHAH